MRWMVEIGELWVVEIGVRIWRWNEWVRNKILLKCGRRRECEKKLKINLKEKGEGIGEIWIIRLKIN